MTCANIVRGGGGGGIFHSVFMYRSTYMQQESLVTVRTKVKTHFSFLLCI